MLGTLAGLGIAVGIAISQARNIVSKIFNSVDSCAPEYIGNNYNSSLPPSNNSLSEQKIKYLEPSLYLMAHLKDIITMHYVMEMHTMWEQRQFVN